MIPYVLCQANEASENPLPSSNPCMRLICNLLLAHLESAYSLNDWVQKIWGTFQLFYDN